MKRNRGVSFKKILKLAKKSFKKAKSYRRKSQSHNRRGGNKQSKQGGSSIAGLDMEKLLGQQQKGGSGVGGGKEGMQKFGESAAPVA
jgi:hypothetical protein